MNDALELRQPDGRYGEMYVRPGLYWVPLGWQAQKLDLNRPGYALPTWDQAAHLAIIWDRDCDRYEARVEPLTDVALARAVAYAQWQAQAEGFQVATWSLDGHAVADFGRDASRVAGRYYRDRHHIDISIRYADGWDWAGRTAWATIYHEVAHASGILSEEVAQIATLEMLAGNANEGLEQAGIGLVCELRDLALSYLRYLADDPPVMPRDQLFGQLAFAEDTYRMMGILPPHQPTALERMNATLKPIYQLHMNTRLEGLERRLFQTEQQYNQLLRRKRQLKDIYPDPVQLRRVRLIYGAVPFAYVWRVWDRSEVDVPLSYWSDYPERRVFKLDELRHFLWWNYGAPGD